MSKVFFSFALADSMFGDRNVTVRREVLTAEQAGFTIAAAAVQGNLVSALNPSHAPTIAAAKERFGIDVPIPPKAPMVSLNSGDILIIMSVRGLPRLEGRHEYTPEEIAGAKFAFAAWTVE